MANVIVTTPAELRELIRVEIRAALATAQPDSPAAAGEPLLMRRRDYARRVGLSTRTLDYRLPAECWAGVGRLRRVRVVEADRHLLATAEPDDSTEVDPIVAAAARAGARGR